MWIPDPRGLNAFPRAWKENLVSVMSVGVFRQLMGNIGQARGSWAMELTSGVHVGKDLSQGRGTVRTYGRVHVSAEHWRRVDYTSDGPSHRAKNAELPKRTRNSNDRHSCPGSLIRASLVHARLTGLRRRGETWSLSEKTRELDVLLGRDLTRSDLSQRAGQEFSDGRVKPAFQPRFAATYFSP